MLNTALFWLATTFKLGNCTCVAPFTVNVTVVPLVGYVPLTFNTADVDVWLLIDVVTLLPLSPDSEIVGFVENILPESTVIVLLKEEKEAPGTPTEENWVVSIVAPEIASTKFIVIPFVLV